MNNSDINPLLTVFIDGLKPESLECMPFVNSLKSKRRIKTELGYSITCHTSMYTGVNPNKHLRWFIWKYSPNSSPFKWSKRLGVYRNLNDNNYIKYLVYRITKRLNLDNTSYFSIPFLWDLSLDSWLNFDLTEKKFWSDPNFLEYYPTIFELLKSCGIDYEIVGMHRGRLDNSSHLIKCHKFNKIKPWTYLFIGDIDPISHRFGQSSKIAMIRLKEIDNMLEHIYKYFEVNYEDFNFMLFSDHGHADIEGFIDLQNIFRSHKLNINHIVHFIDANFARFWFRSQTEKKDVIRILSQLDDMGFILSNNHLKRYNINMPDNRYGDLIFYLDTPYIFDRGKLVIAGKQRNHPSVSAHGYLPDHACSDGVFVSNQSTIKSSHICLEDITPMILSNFGKNRLDYMDGGII